MVGESSCDEGVMLVSQSCPCTMSNRCLLSGRVDDVSEEHSGEHDLAFTVLTAPGEEFLNLIDPTVDIAHEEEVIFAGKLDVLRSRYVLRQVSASANAHIPVATPMEHKCWNFDVTEQGAVIDLVACSHGGRQPMGTASQPFTPSNPVPKALIGCLARSEDFNQAPGSPLRGRVS